MSAAIDFLAAEYPVTPLLLAGFSFGSWVGLRAGCSDSRVKELIGLGLPVGDLGGREFSFLESCAKPKLLVNGEFDRYGSPAKLRALADAFPANVKDQTSVAAISGGDHFFTGHLPELEKTIANWLLARHPDLATRTE